MEDLRSKSCRDIAMQAESYQTEGSAELPKTTTINGAKLKRGRSWSFRDPEMQRKRRVASYKVYSVEGKVKGGMRKSLRWIKDRYTGVVSSWW